ncbi:MAG TPA: hypothetical protein VEK73_15200 [Xanthobacteraceae bacterium]|nr:hypothetical protein [Xanthobacteraceae bacterium]
MDPLEKCLQTLRPLIQAGDTNGLVLAERAIDEFVAAHKGYPEAYEGQRQTGGLNVLQQQLTDIWKTLPTGQSLDFANTVSEYVDRKLRELRESDA